MKTGNKMTWGLMAHLRNLRKSACICGLFVCAVMPIASWASIFSGEQSGKTGMMGNEFFARDIYSQNKIIPGMENLPLGVITLSSGAFKNDSPNFMANHLVPADYVVNGMNDGYEWWEPFAELLPTTYRTLQDKFDDSSSNNLWQTDSIYKWINDQQGINNKYNEETVRNNLSKSCLTNGKECRSVVISNHYSKETDYWSTPSNRLLDGLIPSLKGESYFLDSMAANGAKHFLDEYTGKRFPALMTIYFAGLDHKAHGEKNIFGQEVGGMDEYKSFFKDVADKKILEVVNKLKEKGQFDNKIFIVTADHGHTAMVDPIPTTLYAGTPDERIVTPDVSCELKLTGFGKKGKNEEAELANNNLHIWELGEVMKAVGSIQNTAVWNKYKVLAPKEIASAFVDESGNELLAGATSKIENAHVIAALNGPMAHIYVMNSADKSKVAEMLRLMLQKEDTSGALQWLGLEEIDYKQIRESGSGRMKSSIDQILIRLNGNYCVFDGLNNDGSAKCMTTDPFANAEYVKAWDRINGMNNLDRSGDIVLLMKSKTNTNDLANDRFSTGVSCKSWHGSLNPSDSYVPFIVSYPGGNNTELDKFISPVCQGGQCEGNWKLSDIVKQIIQTQYSGQ